MAADVQVLSGSKSGDPDDDEVKTVELSMEETEEGEDFLPLIALEEDSEVEGHEEPDPDELPLLDLQDLGEDAVESSEMVGSEESLPLLGLDPKGEETAVEAAVDDTVEGAFEDAAFEAGKPGQADLEDLEVDLAATPDTAPLESHQEAADRGDMDLAIERVRGHIEVDQENVELYQRLVEYAFRKNDQEVLISAYLELAACLARTDATTKARAVYQQVLSLSPGHAGATVGLQELDGISGAVPPAQVASSEDYVDLGAMVLGDDAGDTTRWTVPAEAPSGDEEADFARMLGQFKEKVSEHLAADDVGAHHDLGTAYMEMGLLEEAIAEFQMALRASPNHLPTFEVMGRCWMEMEKPDMAARALARALTGDFEIEEELIGIYYLMGRAQEAQGNTPDALEFYEKVFSLDINFEDVTERLRALR
jgi:tetratricopeptide (TPR) repeat protein